MNNEQDNKKSLSKYEKIDFLEMENAMVWVKNSTSTFNTRLDTVEERISGLEDIAEEVMPDEVLRDTEMRNTRLQDRAIQSEKV